MIGYVRAAAVAALLTGGLGSLGCVHTGAAPAAAPGSPGERTIENRYRNWYDESWPDRYNYAAREAVLAPFAQQAANGHFWHQTIWNWYFEPGSDKLTQAGIEKLDSLARETPSPDPKIYLQAARDLRTTPDNVGTIGALRDELTAKRAASVRAYLATQPNVGPPIAYEIYVHDSPVPSIAARFAVQSWNGQIQGYRGGLTVGGVGSTTVSGGASLGSGAGTFAPTGAPGGAAGSGLPGGSNPPPMLP